MTGQHHFWAEFLGTIFMMGFFWAPVVAWGIREHRIQRRTRIARRRMAARRGAW